MRKIYRQTALLLILALLSGCGSTLRQPGNDVPTSQTTAEKEPQSLEPVPVLDYEVPNVQPGLLVNQIGYEPASAKKAIVRGKELPTHFMLVDAVTGSAVFTGTIEDMEYEEASGEYVGYGDFSDFTGEGEYYLECDDIGRSYSFVIKEGLYRELMENALALYREQRADYTKEDIEEVCRSLSVLLLSYELYGTVYDTGVAEGVEPTVIAEIKAGVEWLLTLQDAETGAVMEGEAAQAEQTAWLSAVLAKFSYTYQKFDSVYATACLQAADRAWRFLDKNAEDADREILFYAAAELYRATGQYQYRKLVNSLGAQLVPDAANEALVLGTLTYAATKRKVDADLCGTLVGALFDAAEQVAEKAKMDTFMVGSSSADGVDDMLWNMVVVSSIDYIITNQEYATIIENCHNYLSGANQDALCYVSDDRRDRAAVPGLGESCVGTAEYIMMLSEILSHKEEE
ncbi:MAG: cellulase N-terminal Ig-like domain-containing protein [Lachnospiraceae bacterium]